MTDVELSMTERLAVLLENKHFKDVYVSECKNGPTHDARGGHLRLDGWAMNRSWRHMTFTGYEIKVSRNDFVRDSKMHLYLPLCNQLYLVTPPGLIDKGEVPEQMGLLECTKNVKRLLTRVKAPWREIEPPVDLLLYVLMCRAQISREYVSTRGERMAVWEARLADRKRGREIGGLVRGRIAEHVRDVEDENRRLKSQMETYDSVRKRLEELGWDPDKGINTWNLGQRLAETLTGLPDKIDREIEGAASALNRLVASLRKARSLQLAAAEEEPADEQ